MEGKIIRMQKKKYKRLTDLEREEISWSLANGKTQAEIARGLNRDPTTISREIKRNSGKTGYRAFSASRRARATVSSRRQGKTRLEKNILLREFVLKKL